MKSIFLILVIAVLINNPFMVSAEQIMEYDNNEHEISTCEWDSLLPNTEGKFFQYDFLIDLPTGNGTGRFKMQEHYYDIDNSFGYPPSISIYMDTNVICDFSADIIAYDQWGVEKELHARKDQAYSLYATRSFGAVNTQWVNAEVILYVADDEGEGSFREVDDD